MHKSINLYRLVLHCSIVLIFTVALPLTAFLYAKDHPPHFPFPHTTRNNAMLLQWLLLSLALIPFYFINTYILLPKYLVSRKYLMYVLLILGTFIIALTVSKGAEYLFFQTDKLYGARPYPTIILPMTLLLGIGTSFEMVLQWEKQKRKQETIEKEKASAELSFLKSQINPHFLFNTLNNIYSLAERNSTKTGQSILLLSNLMRYILYDTKQGKILLVNEIKHLEEYIALQRLRIVEVNTVSIQFNNSINTDKILIEPLILIPFVENAFKHGISYAAKSFIAIDLKIEHDYLIFKVHNSKKSSNGKSSPESMHQGVGMVNTQRRLELLYPDRHTLTIKNDHDYYSACLHIKLQNGVDFG
jgi:two-component system, LytTR family, sensor kinase